MVYSQISRNNMKKVLVLYVGGTIGMEKNAENVYAPSPNRLFSYLKENTQFHNTQLARRLNLQTNQLVNHMQLNKKAVIYEIKEYDVLLDSSNMSSNDWIKIAKDIELYYEQYDGFVVLHGTDTLAYTASALSFMLEGLQKSVILTGSQIPIYEETSDAQENILWSLSLAANYNIPEVCIFFAKNLLRGNRTTKISSTKLNAFDSPNYFHLAEMKNGHLSINKSAIRPAKEAEFRVFTQLSAKVGLICLFPTLTASMLRRLLQENLDGLVLETYGLGNIPSNYTEFIDILKETVDGGTFVINITQCSNGTVSSAYETGKKLEEIGIISGHDLTTEAAITKLCFVLGMPGLSRMQKINLLQNDIRGELTPTL